MSQIIAAPASSPVNGATPAGAVNGVNAVYTLPAVPVAGTLLVFLNGILQEGAGTDYVYVNGAVTFAFNQPPLANDRVRVCYSV